MPLLQFLDIILNYLRILIRAYHKELQSLVKIGGLEEVNRNDLPEKAQVLPLLELFNYKFDVVKKKIVFKCRFVIRGDLEQNFYQDTYAPVAALHIIRVVLCLLGTFGFIGRQLDIRTAFLYGRRKKAFYVEMPLGHDSRKKNKVWKSFCAIYGLKDAPKKWYDLISKILRDYGLFPCKVEPCLFMTKDRKLVVVLYVDDLIYFSKKETTLNEFEKFLSKKFTIKITKLITKYVGYEVKINENSLTIHGKGYIKACLERFNLTDCKTERNPGLKGAQEIDEQSNYLECKKLYQQILGCLNYLSGVCRPDIAFTVNFLARCSANPQQSHLKMAKRVFKYLKGTSHYGLKYERIKQTDKVRLTTYSDSDWAACKSTRKSITGYVIFLNTTPIIWKAKKQPIVAPSTFAAEFVSLSSAVEELMFLEVIFKFLNIETEKPYKIYCDNQSAIKAFKQNVVTKQSRHIEVRYHRIKDKCKKEFAKVRYVKSEDNPADIFTKFFTAQEFERQSKKLMNCPKSVEK